MHINHTMTAVCASRGCLFIDNARIKIEHLKNKGIHLNGDGMKILASDIESNDIKAGKHKRKQDPLWLLAQTLNKIIQTSSGSQIQKILTLSAYDPTTLEEKLNKDLDKVQKWLKSNKLTLNVKKTKYMIIGSHQRLRHLKINGDFNIIVSSQQLTRVTNYGYLGIEVEEVLGWQSQVDTTLLHYSHIPNTHKKNFTHAQYITPKYTLTQRLVHLTLNVSALQVLNDQINHKVFSICFYLVLNLSYYCYAYHQYR